MPPLSLNEESHLILINTFFVEAETQGEVVSLLSELTEVTIRTLPGFVSSKIHRSLDGRFVANTAEWVDEDHFYAMLDHPTVQATLERVRGLCQGITPILYQTASHHDPIGGEGPFPFLETWRGPHGHPHG